MKRIFCLLLALLLSACSTQPIVKEDPINLRLTTTTSVNDSGLIEYLRPYILEDLNINLEVVSLGSGAAIEAGQRGECGRFTHAFSNCSGYVGKRWVWN